MLVERKILMFMFKGLNKQLPMVLQKYLIINRRHPEKFLVKFSRTKLRKSCVTVGGVKLWNKLSPDIRSLPSVKLFNKTVKKKLIGKI